MRSRLLWRRSATAVGFYASTAFGILGTVVAARQLDLAEFGVFATVTAAAGFFQALLDVTVEESLTKYGFRYVESEDWGRLRRLFRRALELKLIGGVVAALVLVALAPVADTLFSGTDLLVPVLLIAPLPLLQAPENVSATALLLRGRYDIRSAFGMVSMALRFVGIVIGLRFGVEGAIAGLVIAQVLASAAVGWVGLAAFRRFPKVPIQLLGEHRREIMSFVGHSTLATTVVALRTSFVPVLLGIAANSTQTGLLRVAQAPQTGLTAASSPARLILLTEQTRDWEKGREETVLAGVRNYLRIASGMMVVAVPIFFIFMGPLVRIVFGEKYEDAITAARIVLFAGAVQFVVGWAKSLPVSIGRPRLRVFAHGLETIVLLPLVVVLGAAYGATGAAIAILVSSVVFAAIWVVLLIRLHAEVAERARGATPGAAA